MTIDDFILQRKDASLLEALGLAGTDEFKSVIKLVK